MGEPAIMGIETFSEKSRLGALLFCLLLGPFGAHRFYVGKIGTAICMILTLGGLGMWVVVDFIMIVIGSFRDKQGHRVFKWFETGSI